MCIYNNDINVLPDVFYASFSCETHFVFAHTYFNVTFSFHHISQFSFSARRGERLISVPKKVVILDGINRMVHALNYHTRIGVEDERGEEI